MKNKGIVFYINSLKFFISHRINLAKLAHENNYKVIICCKVDTNYLNEAFPFVSMLKLKTYFLR